MDDDALKEIIQRLVEPVAVSLGLIVWGIEIVRAGRTVLRIFVDVPGCAASSCDGTGGTCILPADSDNDGIFVAEKTSSACYSATLDQCEEISRHLGLALEVENCFLEPYVLEVSTPGLTRQFFSLAQMHPYLGDMMEVRLLAPISTAREGTEMPRRILRGTLQAVEEDAFILAPASVSSEGNVSLEDASLVRIPWNTVRKAMRMYIFKQPQKPGKQISSSKMKGNSRKKQRS